jgi:hypothetical protein
VNSRQKGDMLNLRRQITFFLVLNSQEKQLRPFHISRASIIQVRGKQKGINISQTTSSRATLHLQHQQALSAIEVMELFIRYGNLPCYS